MSTLRSPVPVPFFIACTHIGIPVQCERARFYSSTATLSPTSYLHDQVECHRNATYRSIGDPSCEHSCSSQKGHPKREVLHVKSEGETEKKGGIIEFVAFNKVAERLTQQSISFSTLAVGHLTTVNGSAFYRRRIMNFSIARNSVFIRRS